MFILSLTNIVLIIQMVATLVITHIPVLTSNCYFSSYYYTIWQFSIMIVMIITVFVAPFGAITISMPIAIL